MKCRNWPYKGVLYIEPVDNHRLFWHFFHGDTAASDSPENREFLEDMCRRHGEKLEWVADR